MRRHFIPTLAVAGTLAAAVTAQVPGVSTVPGTPAVPSAAAAPSMNIWSMLCPSAAQKKACQDKLCNSAIGKMASSMMLPMSGLTGGFLSPPCPGPNSANPADLAKPADSAEGAAARIKAEEADVKARIAAVRYLATADCHYWPEAEAALINSLRADKNECVRIEAAKAFLTGCCCNKKTIAALLKSVNGDNSDGHPAERSECVKAIAFLALQKCVTSYVGPPPVPPEPGTAPDGKKPAGVARVEPATPQQIAEASAVVRRGLAVSRETLWKISGRQTVAGVLTGPAMTATAVASSAAPPVAETVAVAEAAAPPKPRGLVGFWKQAAAGDGNN